MKTVFLGFFLSLAAFFTGVIAVLGYRQEWWKQVEAFSYFGWATYIAIAAIILLTIGIIRRKMIALSIFGILISLPIILGTFVFNYSAKIYPPINDITTDIKNPPSLWDMPNPMEYPGEKFAKQQLKSYPDIKTLTIHKPYKTVFDKALQIIQNTPRWKIISKDSDEGQIEAVASSLIFGFKDEVSIRIKRAKNGTTIDMRSRSRIGRIDRGANARRIRAFFKELKK